ncbi:MAG: hypothetical protein VKP62_14570 [Candidatus Sericytochromatia bacterium]|nr:hypothetical protein [Candidatus Sericytochromatia bacterium]
MTELNRTVPATRSAATSPTAPAKSEGAPRAADSATSRAGDTNTARATVRPQAEPRPLDLDRVLANAGLTMKALGDLAEPTQTVSDAAANAADVVLNAEEAAKVVKSLPQVSPAQSARFAKALEGAQKAGKVAGAAGAVVAAHALFQAVHPTLDLKAAGEALANLALGLATAFEDLAPNALGAAGFGLGAVSSLFALANDLQDAQANGLSTSNAMGVLGNALTAAGSVASLLPAGQPVGAALLMAGAAVNLARLAYDNREAIATAGGKALTAVREAGGKALTAMGSWFSPPQLAQSAPRPSVPIARRTAPAPG